MQTGLPIKCPLFLSDFYEMGQPAERLVLQLVGRIVATVF
jgi:hypothetical protein